MADGIMQVSRGRFVGALAKTLPVYVPALVVPGATGVWDARTLRDGDGSPVAAWAAVDGAGPTLTPAGTGQAAPTAPTLTVGADGQQAVRFVAASKNTLGSAFPRAIPSTVITVAQVNSYNAGGLAPIVASGASTSALGHMQAVQDGGVARTYAGTALNLFGSVTGNSYRVLSSVFNGASSVIRMNNTEAVGDSGALTSSVISLASFGNTFSNLDLKKVIYYPFALTATQRADVTAQLMAEYKL